jgi:hypothetical protein
MRLCLRDELPAVPGRSYWRVVFDFVAFSDIGLRGSGRPECCPVWSLAGLAACIEIGKGSHGRCRGRQAAAAMHALGVDGMSRLLSCPRRSQCVAMHPAVGRARIRRYLKPEFGCLRCNRREVFAAALTRYLKSVYAAEPVGIGISFVGRYSESGHGK